ncbi:MAG: EAL domain-containing protein [Legionellales bacterium]|nr:EAL domain-containing protein [Legionellales bacterium]
MDRSITRILLTGGSKEENNAFKTLIAHYLPPHYQALVIQDTHDALIQFDEHTPDCIMLNADPTQQATLALLEAFKRKAKNSVIILLVNEDKTIPHEKIKKAGVNGILIKSQLSAEALKIAIFEAKAQFKFNYYKKYHPAERNFLPESEQFTELLTHGIMHAKQRHRLLALMICEVKLLKNKRSQQQEFTRALAKYISKVVRHVDIVGILDENKIGIILNDMNKLFESSSVAERILESIPGFQFNDIDLDEFIVKLGIANFPLDGECTELLINNANKALEFIRKKNISFYQNFCETPQHNFDQQNMIHDDLHDAVKNGEFYLVFQPIFDLYTKKIVSVEALIRWQHKYLGDIFPNEFIPYAERTGLIEPIGCWVLEETCRHFDIWQKNNIGLEKIFINIASRQLKPDFITLFHHVLNKHHIAPHHIGFDITDIALVKDIKNTQQVIQELRSMCVDVYIDDFGRGFSTLAYFESLPANGIKIDHVFTHGLPDNPSDVAVISSVINLTQRLGVKVIAEGIETVEQYEFLRTHQCQYGQGYFLGKPMKNEELIECLNDKIIN